MREIVLDGPGKNCLSTRMMDFLIGQLAEGKGAPTLLTGAGDAFCAGLDLKEVASLDARGLEAYLRKLEQLVDALYRYPGPTVCAANGHAIAGGCVLLLCCDVRVLADSPKVKVGLNELALGVAFPPKTLAIVRDKIPAQRHREVILGAGLHGPDAALRLGLVDEVAPNAGRSARRWLETLAAHPPAVYAQTKRAMLIAEPDAAQCERAFQSMLPVWADPDLRARILGRLAK